MVGENNLMAKNALKIILYKARNGIKIFWWTQDENPPWPNFYLPDFWGCFLFSMTSPGSPDTWDGNPVIVRLSCFFINNESQYIGD